MEHLSPHELISLRETLQREAAALESAQATDRLIKDPEFKTLSEAGLKASRQRIAGMQRFLEEHGLVADEGVH